MASITTCCMTCTTASRRSRRRGSARRWSRTRLFWLEDPTPAENQEAFRLIRQHTTTPLAVGEIFNTIWDAKDLIQEQLIDYIRMTVVRAGGITHLRRIADFAALYQVRTGCHGATDLSPVTHGRGAALRQLGAELRHPGIHARTPRRPTRCSRTPTPSRTATCIPARRTGHGVDIDEALAAKYPYQRAYLPVARLEDGTMWNW